MFRVAERQLGLGLSVVADCPFARVSLYQRALELVSKVERLQCAPAAFAGSARHEAADQQQSLLPPATIRPPAEAVGTAPAGDTPCGSAFEPPEEGCKRSTTGSNLKQETRLLVVVVDVECSDEGLWRRRLDARGAEDAGTERSHKPGSWEQLQDLLSRYGDSWKWSTSGSAHVPYHVRVDTTAASTAECVATVLGYLKALKQAPRGGSSAATAGL
ncbi:hypothetical protein CHLRE_17g743997v5 [Chlamydomonas reinhardtii]|uniref:Uncharacterized protein n=1 Tax=Chlamydomonas reinhardtii TaxID=3055 RepID=A0A2K3CRY6_CHLRE|nr:uncharacterized protein CHLRE_17g743997v5 [Chlamydomonas reinhardtii]PNW71041.1 hypothetical protein CHLRE_17g743997v5 [Chlamydomonas reinhardtii]